MRKLCWFAIPCSASIFLAVCLLPERYLVSAGLLCALGAFGSLFLTGKARRRLLLAALGLSLGFLWTALYGQLFRSPALALTQSHSDTYVVTVADFPKETSRGISFVGRIQTAEGLQPKVQIYAGQDTPDLHPGDRISATLRLSPSSLIRGEETDYFPSKGIYLFGYAQGEISLLSQAEAASLRFLPQRAAKLLKEGIAAAFPEDVSGFMTALITGDKSFLPTGLYTAFQRSGIAHLVAVSGLHIGFLAGLCLFLFGRSNRLSLAVSMILIFFFAALSGNSPSALRAALMTTFLLLAPLVRREPDPPTTLAAILLLLLLPCPYAASSISLQLSFAAVAGIYLLSGRLSSLWLQRLPSFSSPIGKGVGRILRFLCITLSTTLGALLFTTPLAAFHFHTVSLAGPLTNLLTLWVASFTFLGGLVSALLHPFLPTLSVLIAHIVAWPARWIIGAARTISHWPFASISLLSGFFVLWFVVSYSIFLLWLLGRKVRPTIALPVLTVTLCCTILTYAWPTLTSPLTASVLNVGQGASTLFYSKGCSILVDCGGSSAEDAGDLAADHLQALGTSHLDALILTHFHTDHAGGVPELLSRVDVSLLILPDVTPEDSLRQEILTLAGERGCQVKFIANDATVSFGAASLRIFAPLGRGTANEEGLSLLCSYGDYDILLTGDMDSTIEQRLVKYKSLPDIELLIVGHHGSKRSTGELLLQTTKPELAVISVGYNSYGHPTPETLQRLQNAGCQVYRTDLKGTVTFHIKENTP